MDWFTHIQPLKKMFTKPPITKPKRVKVYDPSSRDKAYRNPMPKPGGKAAKDKPRKTRGL